MRFRVIVVCGLLACFLLALDDALVNATNPAPDLIPLPAVSQSYELRDSAGANPAGTVTYRAPAAGTTTGTFSMVFGDGSVTNGDWNPNTAAGVNEETPRH